MHLGFNSKHCDLRAPAETDLDFLGHAATPLRVQTLSPGVGSYPPLPAMSTRCSLCSPPVLGWPRPGRQRGQAVVCLPPSGYGRAMIPVSVCLGPWTVVPMSEVYRQFYRLQNHPGKMAYLSHSSPVFSTEPGILTGAQENQVYRNAPCFSLRQVFPSGSPTKESGL